MFSKFRLIATAVAITFITVYCSNKETIYQTDKSGLSYRFFTENNESQKAALNDILEIKFRMSTENDSVIEETDLFRIRLEPPSHSGGSIEDGLALMHVGDSAVFLIDAELYYTKTRGVPLPKYLKKGDRIKLYVKLQEIINLEEFETYRKKMYHRSREQEMQLLDDYIERTNVTVEPTNSGLYFIEMKKGSGKNPVPGQQVTVHYTGYFIDGKRFSTTYGTGKPFAFRYGSGDVIAGWEEGIGRMQAGGKYKLIIPSYLAYGDEGRGELILPFSTLVFEIELLAIQ